MKVTKKDLIGDIELFPVKVVQKMCEKQVEQGNKFDVSVFQNDRFAHKDMGGFDWFLTKEGLNYWNRIIEDENF